MFHDENFEQNNKKRLKVQNTISKRCYFVPFKTRKLKTLKPIKLHLAKLYLFKIQCYSVLIRKFINCAQEKNASMRCVRFYTLFFSILMGFNNIYAQAIPVKLQKTNAGYTLLRNGEPYTVRGGGGQVNLDKLEQIGGNSIRTWSTDNAREYLDNAQKHGLTVMMGLWLGHERHGFDYNDTVAVRKQFDYFKKQVLELRNHPALLFWGIGNEVDLFYTNTRVWNAVQDIAKMIHELDPNHPTSTVTAGLDSNEVKLIKSNCPDIDIYCVNTYGDLNFALNHIKGYGWSGPYMITEWGPNGHWEVAKTPWGAPLEQTGTEKALTYHQRYLSISSDSNFCLGSYLFLWGQKQETTPTWYGLFDEKGNATEALDFMHAHWKKSAPANKTPELQQLGFKVQDSVLRYASFKNAEKIKVIVKVRDAENDRLVHRYKVIPESQYTKAGGDAEISPEPIGIVFNKNSEGAIFKAPSTAGTYRLFYSCYDGNGHVAYGNLPFQIQASKAVRSISFKTRHLKHEFGGKDE
jgi:hypothetical protein